MGMGGGTGTGMGNNNNNNNNNNNRRRRRREITVKNDNNCNNKLDCILEGTILQSCNFLTVLTLKPRLFSIRIASNQSSNGLRMKRQKSQSLKMNSKLHVAFCILFIANLAFGLTENGELVRQKRDDHYEVKCKQSMTGVFSFFAIPILLGDITLDFMSMINVMVDIMVTGLK